LLTGSAGAKNLNLVGTSSKRDVSSLVKTTTQIAPLTIGSAEKSASLSKKSLNKMIVDVLDDEIPSDLDDMDLLESSELDSDESDNEETTDEDYDDTSSSMSSPSSLTCSSGCSTPTKNKAAHNQHHLSQTTSMASMKSEQTMANHGQSTHKKAGKQSKSGGAKRNSRLQSMGYSSDNPAEKRAFHILSERQRRNDLKKLFETLRNNIPVLCDKQKASKLTILKAAVDHLVDVSGKRDKLSSVYEKEKARHVQLLAQLKSLQQLDNNSGFHHHHHHRQTSSALVNGGSSVMTTLAVH